MTILTDKRRLVWIGPGGPPPNLRAAAGDRWEVLPCPSLQAAASCLRDAQLVVVSADHDDPLERARLTEILDQVRLSGAVALLLLPAGADPDEFWAQRGGQVITAATDASSRELTARLDAAVELRSAVRNLRSGAPAENERPGEPGEGFLQLQEQMRLAARLQRDFLPHSFPEVGPIRFAAMFRPASWVSGDFYDVFRLDETHVGFYVADVVGHGMPAALLTMFIKKALPTKQITGNTYEIIPPNQALAQLNAEICEQELSYCQFCTAAYGVVDAGALQLSYARGGHPCPLLLTRDGDVRQLDAAGTLLGVFPGERYQARQVELNPGDRVVMFSDGTQEALHSPAQSGEEALVAELLRLRPLPAEAMLLQLTARINERRDVTRPKDDMTVLVMDVLDR